ncbi:uroporphyrinogen-III C-methyltransferase [Primorskyibacter sp. S187A]|uniref:uroporphyrinogen-III C-methyltransferase n=1 Tax=Primorskyibacter sp. S187A TaxID=3415130 RepID=UPI003C7B406C
MTFIGAGPGDPDLLTVKALRALQSVDVVLHDRLIAQEILDLIPACIRLIDVGKKGFGRHTPQDEINALLVAEAQKGARVVRLKAGDCTVFGRLDEEMDALEQAGLSFTIIPGITSASAAVAALNQSFTRRGRNSSVRLLTGHDTKGFADQDWRSLTQPGQVAAIYMGARAARFVQSRLLMHGAAPETPVSFVENASRPDERIIASTLAHMSQDLVAARLSGPVLTFWGLSPRAAQSHLPSLQEEFA